MDTAVNTAPPPRIHQLTGGGTTSRRYCSGLRWRIHAASSTPETETTGITSAHS